MGTPQQEAIEYLRQVQAAFLPETCPSCVNAHIIARSRMLGGVGGDFYDFPEVAHGLRGLIIGDITGHGLRPALVMAMVFGALRGIAPQTESPRDALGQINRMLVDLNLRLAEEWGLVMCSMFYGIMDVDRLTLTYANAGHLPPIACRGDLCELSPLLATAPPLGVVPDVPFDVRVADLQHVKRMFFYTDGLLDALGGAKAGINRLSEILSQTRSLSPEAQLQTVFDEAQLARRQLPKSRRDDASAFVVSIRARAE